MNANLVEVTENRIVELEKDHECLELMREKVRRIRYAESEVESAKVALSDKKKKLENLNDDLVTFIEEGPPKPDPQATLPFAREESLGEEDDDDLEIDDDDIEPPEVASEGAADKKMPPFIDELNLTERQKRKLAETGVKTQAELIDLVNCNLDKYPKGLGSLTGFGAQAIKRLVDQLPSTAAESENSVPTEVKKITLMSFGGDKGEGKFEPGDCYEARIMDDGSAVVQLPGDEPVSFTEDEYKLAE